MCDVIKAALNIRIEDIFVLVAGSRKDGLDCIVCRATGAEAVAVRLKFCFPFRLKSQFDQGLMCPVEHDRDAQRPLLRPWLARLGYPDPSGGFRLDSLWVT